MASSRLLEVVRRPLSPDTRLEIPASQKEYEQVDEILEREEARYPRLFYDSAKGVAIVVAQPTPLHSGMAGGLLSCISDESLGGALQYCDGDRFILMIAVEVGVSQSYDSLRAAISWSVCALRCRLGLSISISEGIRRTTANVRYFASNEEAVAMVEEAENDFRSQLLQHPYGPLEHEGITWFGKVRRVILETYRIENEDCAPETILEPSQSFTIVEDGEYVGHNISPNLGELVLEDCIPSHLLQGQEIRATPVNFFHQEWLRTNIGPLWFLPLSAG
ncbi:uncharacterized protein V1513DRAFT_481767 [Lipomyces chichibuensis]|uniref:uncharacterized protein n=1 Tax=Lipomyces chichibuensis TaxID=1546026 RepID=UPI00334424AD